MKFHLKRKPPEWSETQGQKKKAKEVRARKCYEERKKNKEDKIFTLQP